MIELIIVCAMIYYRTQQIFDIFLGGNMKIFRITSLIIISLILISIITSCSSERKFRVLAGSENQPLEQHLQNWAKSNHLELEIKHAGNVEIMRALSREEFKYDAVWVAQPFYIMAGDERKRTKDGEAIYTALPVIGVRESAVQSFGWQGNTVSIHQITDAVKQNQFRFAIGSASQSNSGLMMLLGVLNDITGSKGNLSTAQLNDPNIANTAKEFYTGVGRESGQQTEDLTTLFMESELDGLVTSEPAAIALNQKLIAQGKTPLKFFYIQGIASAIESHFAYVDNGDKFKQESFEKLQKYMTGEIFKNHLSSLGFRTGIGGDTANPAIFKSEWGLDPNKQPQSIPLPSQQTIQQALSVYQTMFRKPVFRVICLDYSSSMEGKGIKGLREGVRFLIDPATARADWNDFNSGDRIVVVAFSNTILSEWTATGDNTNSLKQLITNIDTLSTRGGTDIYSPIIRALAIIDQEPNLQSYTPQIILMTDGQSNTGASYMQMKQAWDSYQPKWKGLKLSVPVFSIAFGDADMKQVTELSESTQGLAFDGHENLVEALHNVGGYK